MIPDPFSHLQKQGNGRYFTGNSYKNPLSSNLKTVPQSPEPGFKQLLTGSKWNAR
jgi:hypothetical protein